MIVRLAALVVLGILFTASLVAAASTPPVGEREFSDFRACITSIPHPSTPWAVLARDAAAKRRALALLGAEDACAHGSGYDGSGAKRPLEWLRELRPGASESNGTGEYFARCSRARHATRGVVDQIGMAIDCYKVSGGLTATQFELSTGFNPKYDFFAKRAKNEPILSKRRFPRTMLHARDGTWWNDSCS